MRKIVFMYHDVYSNSEKESGFQFVTSFPYKVDACKFEKQVKYAYDYCKKNNLPIETIEFTFDDGGVSFYTVIAPILEKYGFRGIFFISTSYINKDKFLTDEQIKSLHERGHIIASHSHTHPRNMTLLPAEEILQEWKTSIKILSDIIGASVSVASIPCGFSSSELIDMAKKAGVTTLYTSIPTNGYMSYKSMELVGRYVILCNTKDSKICSIINSRRTRNLMYIRWKLISLTKSLLGTYYNKIKNIIVR